MAGWYLGTMPVLSRVQQNAIYTIAEQAGLNPLDFGWAQSSQNYRGLIETFKHGPTQGWIDFSLRQGDLWIRWWPNFQSGDASVTNADWAYGVAVVRAWMAEVKKNHDAPDLWGEARKAREITDAAGHLDEANTPFTGAEIELLKPKLAEVEAYIESRQPLDAQQKKVVHGRFQYLLGAAKRGLGRVDWLNVFVSQLVQMFTDGMLNSSLYGDVMRHAATALSTLMKLGSRLLGP